MTVVRVCFGTRAAPAAARTALVAASEGRGITVQDAGASGLWVHADTAAIRGIARAWAACLDRPIRCYRVELSTTPEGVRVRGGGETLHPDGTSTAIASASEDHVDHDDAEDLEGRADAWLRIALEIHEDLDDADSRFERWPLPA